MEQLEVAILLSLDAGFICVVTDSELKPSRSRNPTFTGCGFHIGNNFNMFVIDNQY